MQGEDLVYEILRSIDNEMDPPCLMLAFQLVQRAISLFPILPNMVYQDAFDILSKYFPVYFTHVSFSDILLNPLVNSLIFLFLFYQL